MDIDRKISIIRGLDCVYNTIKTGSYTKAAERCYTQQSNVTTRIAQLQDFLNVTLFSKAPHGMVPTYEGLAINEFAERIDALLHELENYSSKGQTIAGNIVLWTTDGIGSCLIPGVVEFQNRYQGVQFKINCTNELPHFSQREADIAVVYKEPKKGEPVAIEEFNLKFGLFASPAYISRYGLPKDLDDLLENHRIIDRDEYINTWQEWRELIAKARYVVGDINSSTMMAQATKEGMGVALHPINYGKAQPNMIPINIDLNLEHKCWMLTHYDDQKSERIIAIKDFIRNIMERLQETG